MAQAGTDEELMFGPDAYPLMCEMTDRFGNRFQYGNAGDYWLLPFPVGKDNDYSEHSRSITNMEIRDDDIIVVGFPKTGSHWTCEMIHMLMVGSSKMDAKERKQQSLVLVDMNPKAKIDAMESPRILTTHLPFRHFPKQAFEKKVKIVFLERNPKDVYVSFYSMLHKLKRPQHYPGTFEHFAHLMLENGYCYGELFWYLMDWQEGMEKHPDQPFFTSVFEDVKQDPLGGVVKLNEFLGTGRSQELCEEIATACHFQGMKTYKDSTAPPIVKSMFKSGQLGFFRKGDVGDWKNWFTVALNEKFDAIYKKKMAQYKRTYKYE